MKIKVTLAIITGIVAIVVAAIQYGPGWASSGGDDPKPGNGKNGQSTQTMVMQKELGVAEKIIEQRNWSEAGNDPAFRWFVRSRFHKNIEELNPAERVTFWQDMQKYLDEEKEADKKYAEIKQQTVGDELKRLFNKIDQAKGSFDYEKVDRLLQGFEEKHVDLISDLAKVYYLRGQNLELQVKYQDAETYYRKAVALEDQNSLYLNDYAGILKKLGKYGEAEPLSWRALSIDEKTLGSEHPEVATSLYNLAVLLRAKGKYGEAELLSRRALRIYEKALGSEHPSVATSLYNLAELLRTKGKYGEAEPLSRRVLSINEKALGSEHPSVAISLYNLALLLQDQGKYGEAEPLFRRALSIDEKALGSDHLEVTTSLNNLALLLQDRGKYGEAETLFWRALRIYEKALGSDHPEVATSLNNLVVLFQAQGRYGEAELFCRRALGIIEKQLGSEHPNFALGLNNLAVLLSDQGKYLEAELLYQRALKIVEVVLGTSHPHTITVRKSLERLQQKM